MSKPFLSKFAVAQAQGAPSPSCYNIDDEALLDCPEIVLSRSQLTEAKGDPTGDESTDR